MEIKKALECLEKNSELFDEIALENKTSYKDGTVIEAYLFHANQKAIKQTLTTNNYYKTAFELINEKRVDINLLHWAYPSCEAYNMAVREQKDSLFKKELTPEEFELLGRLAGAK